jgi:manganese/iron transport system ATP-binding protein
MASERYDRVMLLNQRLIGLGNPQQVLETSTLLKAYGGHMQVLPLEGGFLAMDDTCCDDETQSHD